MKEFKEFALTGSVFDLAVGFILGGAISALIKSLVDNIISPIIGMLFGSPDFSRIMLGSTMIGSFINALIAFLILAFVLFPDGQRYQQNEEKRSCRGNSGPSTEEILLTQIRELLKKNN